jgi:ubiquinone/menaquinone biosynthesis C-methylase UbiE
MRPRAKNARVFGIDYSAAMEVAEQNFKHNPDVCICQADALILPLKPQTLDGAFSIGVLHHTPNPQRGVEQAFRAPDFRWSLLDTFESVTPSY